MCFWKKKPAVEPQIKPNSEEYAKMYSLFVEVSGKNSILRADLEALKLELDNLKTKMRYNRTKNPEDSAESSGLAHAKALNSLNPFA